MIIDEVVLHNYGVYKDRQSIKLSPKSSKKPIILVGALNGSGKTTLLDALQLGLFGKRAACLGRDSVSYDQFLSKSIHRDVPPGDGASIEISLRRIHEGTEQNLRIQRSWSKPSGKLKESFRVVVDDVLDHVLTDQWAEYVEDLIPSRIAPLFFFDGEKIEQLADPDQSSDILSTAIHSLLGLDIVDQLATDLRVFRRRQAVEEISSEQKAQLAAIKRELASAKAEVTGAYEIVASAETRLTSAENRLARVERDFEERGGNLFLEREHLKDRNHQAKKGLMDLRTSCRELVVGELPLTLVGNQLAELNHLADQEYRLETESRVGEVIKEHDDWLISRLADTSIAKDELNQLKKDLADLQSKETNTSEAGLKLNFGPGVRRKLSAIQELLPGQLSEARQVDEQIRHHRAVVDDLERKLSSLPAEEQVEELLKQVRAAERELGVATEQVEVARRKHAEAKSKYRMQQEAITKLYGSIVATKHQNSETTRILAHAEYVQQTVGEFRNRVVRYHIERLQGLILECFNSLVRKGGLVESVSIDPETFQVELRDGGWRLIQPEDLSAGERQLFAVSLIWALGRASGRVLPTIIDTPLGRLDSVHREHLIKRYFPKASHQVILLSTDEEIDSAEFEKIKGKVSRAYTLNFDATRDGSVVKEGYF